MKCDTCARKGWFDGCRTCKPEGKAYRYFPKGMSISQLLSRVKLSCLCVDSTTGRRSDSRGHKEITKRVRNALGQANHLAHKLGFNVRDCLEAVESRRTYWALNYYGEGKTQRIGTSIEVFESEEGFKKKFSSGKYICPACGEVSTDPHVCNSGKKMNTKSGVCDWKSYGLFGCMGKGYSYIIRNDSPLTMKSGYIFKPVELEVTK